MTETGTPPFKLAREQRPRGRAQRIPGAQLDVHSTISQSDVDKAKAAWRQVAQPAFRTLLDARG